MFHFNDTLLRADAVAELRAEGDRSRLAESLTDLATHFDQGALAAVVVLTDGAHNGGAVNWDALGATGIPVHAVGIGPTRIAGDVELAELALPSRTSPNAQVAARLVIRHTPARDSGYEVRVRVVDGESVLAAESISVDPATPTFAKDIVFPAGALGLKELTVELEAPPDDPLPGNNRQSALLDVTPDRHRVLYLEGEPRWEFKFIRRAVAEDDDIELLTWLRTTPRKTYRQGTSDPDELAEGFPISLEALYRYDMVIIGSLPATSLSDEQHDWLARFVAERGGGLLALAGRQALDNGGWDVKPLARTLPVTVARPGDTPNYGRGNYAANPTDAGLRSVLTDIGGTGSREQSWETLPMLGDYQPLGTPKPGATVILEALGRIMRSGADVVVLGGAAKPLLVTQPYGYGRTAVLATASTWRWRMRTPPDDSRHSLFWRHLIRHFASAALPRRQLSLHADGDSLAVRVGLKNPRYEPLTDTAITAHVTAPDGESFEVALGRIAGESAFGETIPAPNPGIYRVEVAGLAGPAMSEGGSPDPLAALARVGEANREQFGANLNDVLLRRLAEATGGHYWLPDDPLGTRRRSRLQPCRYPRTPATAALERAVPVSAIAVAEMYRVVAAALLGRYLARISHQPLVAVTKLFGNQMVGMSIHRIDRSQTALAAPSPVFWPRARTCDLNRSPAMLSVASTRTEPKSSAIIAATGEISGLDFHMLALRCTNRGDSTARTTGSRSIPRDHA